MLAYSNLPMHRAYENPHSGGVWLSTLARLLREKRHLSSVDNLLKVVNWELKRRMGDSQFQQPEILSMLDQNICLDPGYSTLYTFQAAGFRYTSCFFLSCLYSL